MRRARLRHTRIYVSRAVHRSPSARRERPQLRVTERRAALDYQYHYLWGYQGSEAPPCSAAPESTRPSQRRPPHGRQPSCLARGWRTRTCHSAQ